MSDARLRELERGDDPDAYLAALARAGETLAPWREVAGRPVMAAAERAWRLGWSWWCHGPDVSLGFERDNRIRQGAAMVQANDCRPFRPRSGCTLPGWTQSGGVTRGEPRLYQLLDDLTAVDEARNAHARAFLSAVRLSGSPTATITMRLGEESREVRIVPLPGGGVRVSEVPPL